MNPEYNFAFLDEGSKREIRRSILKAVAVPGYQVPFGRARTSDRARAGGREAIPAHFVARSAGAVCFEGYRSGQRR